MNKPLVYGLIVCILMVIAPHVAHLPLWVSALGGLLLTWRTYLTHYGKPLPNRWLLMALTVCGIAGIVVNLHTLFGREAGVTLLILLAALKLLELKAPRDAMVLIYLSCFICITNFFYSQSIPTALYMLLTLLAILTAWLHLYAPSVTLSSRLRTAAVLLLQAIPLMTILFVLFPRVQGPLWGLPQDAYASSGLDDKMSPGSFARLILSEDVAFRVTYSGSVPRRDQMYWRGPVLWHFDGRTWSAGVTAPAAPAQLSETAQPIDYSVTLEPHNKPWLFLLDAPQKISVASIQTSDLQTLSKAPIVARMRYSASSFLSYRANLNEPDAQLKRALQLPHNYNPRAVQLASEWRIQHNDPTEIVRAALAYFNRQNFQYTLEPPALGKDSVDEFLFTTRQGFCEHYASAFVFLMRAAGIPARVVTGYQGGEFNGIGNYYIVRQSDAHAWAEVWLEHQGWMRIDPTAAIAPARVQNGLSAAVSNNTALPFMARNPPQWLRELQLNLDALANQWNQWVLGYNSERQFALLTRLGMRDVTWQNLAIALSYTLGAAVAILSLFTLRHLYIRRRSDPVQTAWLRLCCKLAKTGLPRAAHEGALDFAQRVAVARPALANAIQDIALRYNQLRYGSAPDETTQRDFVRRAAALKV
jgi:transglutaminase-like putative cysteine protease